jgi:hypothetical protein
MLSNFSSYAICLLNELRELFWGYRKRFFSTSNTLCHHVSGINKTWLKWSCFHSVRIDNICNFYLIFSLPGYCKFLGIDKHHIRPIRSSLYFCRIHIYIAIKVRITVGHSTSKKIYPRLVAWLRVWSQARIFRTNLLMYILRLVCWNICIFHSLNRTSLLFEGLLEIASCHNWWPY